MKIMLSYFYQIRFFKPNMIPVSTAVWDPAWFRRDGQIFKDKHGVWNGIRLEDLHPDDDKCAGLCPCEHHHTRTGPCKFLTAYREQLNDISFIDLFSWCEKLARYVQKKEEFEEEPIVVLIVYEAPNNPCSERGPLMSWFADNGYELKEWTKNAI